MTFMHKSYIYRDARTKSGVFGHVFHVESKHRTSASFYNWSNIDILQYVAQSSTRTRQNTLYVIMPRTYTNLYIGIVMYKQGGESKGKFFMEQAKTTPRKELCESKVSVMSFLSC